MKKLIKNTKFGNVSVERLIFITKIASSVLNNIILIILRSITKNYINGDVNNVLVTKILLMCYNVLNAMIKNLFQLSIISHSNGNVFVDMIKIVILYKNADIAKNKSQ